MPPLPAAVSREHTWTGGDNDINSDSRQKKNTYGGVQTVVCLSIHADHGHRIHFPSPRVHLGRGSFGKVLSVAASSTLLVQLVVAVTAPSALLARLLGALRHGGPSLPKAATAAAAAATAATTPLAADTRLPPGPVAPTALLFLRLTVDHFTVLLHLGERVAGQASLHLSGHFPTTVFLPPSGLPVLPPARIRSEYRGNVWVFLPPPSPLDHNGFSLRRRAADAELKHR